MKNHDISFDKVVLSYPQLLQTAQIAFAASRETIRRHLAKMDNFVHYGEKCSVALESEWLKNAANQLEVSANTLEALEAMKTRQDAEFINRPEVKKSN